jgi:alpha-1,2-mannosyltransferase
MFALFKFYHAPLDIVYHFQYNTVPTILSSLGYQPVPPPPGHAPKEGDDMQPEWDYSPLATLDPPIRLCYGNEWHRFPGSYLVPNGVEVGWVKSEFEGIMPRRWEESAVNNSTSTGKGAKGGKSGVWPRDETRVVREGRFNGLNVPSVEPGAYVSEDSSALPASAVRPCLATEFSSKAGCLILPG